jgi:hypothetical protein
VPSWPNTWVGGFGTPYSAFRRCPMDDLGGWVKLWRRLLRHPLYKALTDRERNVMVTIVLMVNWRDTLWFCRTLNQEVVIPRGALVSSQLDISREAGPPSTPERSRHPRALHPQPPQAGLHRRPLHHVPVEQPLWGGGQAAAATCSAGRAGGVASRGRRRGRRPRNQARGQGAGCVRYITRYSGRERRFISP